MSYGQPEALFGEKAAVRECNEFGKVSTPVYLGLAAFVLKFEQLSLTGMTFLISSGDSGVADREDVCVTDSGVREEGGPDFLPGIAVNCPYVTAVGATQIKEGFLVSYLSLRVSHED